MAYIETNFRANDGSGPMVHYFNLHGAVGSGCPNRRDDVALVQHLLRALGNLPESPVQNNPLQVDGIWTPALGRAVLLFQKLANRGLRRRGAGEFLAVDGQVVPARGIYRGATLQMYTIVALNKAYAHYYWPDYRQWEPMRSAEKVGLQSV